MYIDQATGWKTGESWFISWQGRDIFLYVEASRLTDVQLVSEFMNARRALSVGGEWPRHEADRLLPHNPKVKNEWNYTATYPYAFMVYRGAALPYLEVKSTNDYGDIGGHGGGGDRDALIHTCFQFQIAAELHMLKLV